MRTIGGVRRLALAVALLGVAVACAPAEVPEPGRSLTGALPTAEVAAPRPLPRSGAAAAPERGLGNGRSVTLAFGGDVNFEGGPRQVLEEDPDALLSGVAPALEADLTMVNLETAVTERGTPVDKEFVFRAPASAFAALRTAGVDVVTLANNHGMDFGLEGLEDTLVAAEDPTTGLPLVGAGRTEGEAYQAHRVVVRGQRLSIIGATRVIDSFLIGPWSATPDAPGLAVAEDPTRLLEAVRAERPAADTLVVYLHWGREREPCPIPDQPSVADELIAAGADVVVGAHAHVPLAGGMRGGAYVHYGLGNFVFGSASGPTADSGILRLSVTGRRIDAAEWVPVELVGGVPRLLAGEEARQARQEWQDLRGCADLEAGTEVGAGPAGGAEPGSDPTTGGP